MTPDLPTRGSDGHPWMHGVPITIRTRFGQIRYVDGPESRRTVGDRSVATPIEVDFPGNEREPSLFMRIEMLAGVPRCTELTLRRRDNGHEIRAKDLEAMKGLDGWIEWIVGVASQKITELPSGGRRLEFVMDDESFRDATRAISVARRRSRRPRSAERVKRAADVYNAHEHGGLEAIEFAFGVSKSTASRLLADAREAGLITKPRAR